MKNNLDFNKACINNNNIKLSQTNLTTTRQVTRQTVGAFSAKI